MEIYIVDSSSESNSFQDFEKDTPSAIQDETTSERSIPNSELSEMIDVNDADTSDNHNDKRIVVSGYPKN